MTIQSIYAFHNKRQCKVFIKEIVKTSCVEYTIRKKERRKVYGPMADFYKAMGLDGVKYEVECIINDEQKKQLDYAYDNIMGSE